MNDNHGFIRLHGLYKGFQEGGQKRSVLREADAGFARGEFVAILGKSGSGKSTLLNLISGIDLVDEGDIWVAGLRLTSLKERWVVESKANRAQSGPGIGLGLSSTTAG